MRLLPSRPLNDQLICSNHRKQIWQLYFLGRLRRPVLFRFAESVCQRAELSSNGRDGDLVEFSSSAEAVSEAFENLIVMAGDESGLSCP